MSPGLRDAVGRRVRRWVDGVGKLAELNDADRNQLTSHGLDTRAALAEHVGRAGLTKTVQESRVDRDRLLISLAHYAQAEADGRTRALPLRVIRTLWRNRREGVLLALLLLAIFGVRRALERPERVVIAARDLVPYQVIGETDVGQRKTEAGFDTYPSLDSVIGLYPLRVINAGEPVRRDLMSRVRIANPADLRDRRVLGLSVTRQSAALAAPGSRVILLFTPTAAEDTAQRAVRDAIVLDARAAGDTSSIVVAMRLQDFNALGPLVARSTVTVVQQAMVP